MIKNVLCIILLSVFLVLGAKYHTDSRGAEIHTSFRWVVADSAARMALSVVAADTQKLCFQVADTTIWMLTDNSPKNWAWVSGKKADSLWIRTFQAVTAGITRMNVDTSKTRHPTADSATIPVLRGNVAFRGNITGNDAVFDSTDHRIITSDSITSPIIKGVTTLRDSCYFASGIRGMRLYMPWAVIDTFRTDFWVKGSVRGWSQSTGGTPFVSYGTTKRINGYFGTLSNNDGGMLCYDSSGSARIQLTTRGSSYLYGSLAINQSTPDSTLTINGSFHVTGNSKFDGTVKAQGSNPSTPAYTSYGSTGKVNGYFGTLGNNNGGMMVYDSNNVPKAMISSSPGATSYVLSKFAVGNNTADSTGLIEGSFHVTGNTLIDGALTTTSLKLGSGDLLSVYDTGSFPCTLKTSDVTVQQIGRIKYECLGQKVYLTLPSIYGTSNSENVILYTGILAAIKPIEKQLGRCNVINNGGALAGGNWYFDPTNNYIVFTTPTGAFATSGTKGIGDWYTEPDQTIFYNRN